MVNAQVDQITRACSRSRKDRSGQSSNHKETSRNRPDLAGTGRRWPGINDGGRKATAAARKEQPGAGMAGEKRMATTTGGIDLETDRVRGEQGEQQRQPDEPARRGAAGGQRAAAVGRRPGSRPSSDCRCSLAACCAAPRRFVRLPLLLSLLSPHSVCL